MTPSEIARNTLLAELRPNDLQLFLPDAKFARRAANHLLYTQGQNIDVVYFPLDNTLVSYVVDVEGDHAIETTTVGREGAVGGIVSHGNLPAYTRIMVQAEGEFIVVPLTSLERAKKMSRTIENLFARYADCLMAQIFQATACNATHSVEQRAAKWILASFERTGTNPMPLTQERLAAMLGVGRSYMSRVIQGFKADGTLSVRRGQVYIVEPAKLEAKACGCNAMVKAHFETVLKGVYPAAD